MSETFVFVHQFPEHPSERTFEVNPGQQVSSATISVRRMINKSGSRCFFITAKELPRPLCLWDRDEYDTQAAGAGFGQAEVEARIDEVLAAV